ncbi:Hypothetical protein PACV_246, partial [Pacmanvirus A23]|uniref:Hypothetical protein n=1 Tax=Pacmanvirus A23 TaxID=1932881 RepID=UPI000A0931E0
LYENFHIMGHNNQNWVYGDEWVCPIYQRGPYCKDCCELTNTVLASVGNETESGIIKLIQDTFKILKSDKIPIDFEGLDDKKISAVKSAFPNHNLIKFAWNELYMLRAQCDHNVF